MGEGCKQGYIDADEYRGTIAKNNLENVGVKIVVLNQHDTVHQSFGEFLVYVSDIIVAKAVELLKNFKSE